MSAQKFTRTLMHWHRHQNDRTLPWKAEKDPYKIWLSEIILQQTRAAQGLPYYLKFIEQFPTIQDLAAATDEAVFKCWQGLGYYARCRNMLATARIVSDTYDGKFPSDYESILALPGIGPYTAAAIMSFAYGASYPVVDGNVYRVLARYFHETTPIDHSRARKVFTTLSQQLIDDNNPAGYNQAIMDFGATVCTPSLPACDHCPLAEGCYAFQQEMVDQLPIKVKKMEKRHRYFAYLLIQLDGAIYFEQRTAKDIWQGLYQPYLIELAEAMLPSAIAELIEQQLQAADIQMIDTHKQVLTHQVIHSYWFKVKIVALPANWDKTGAFIPLNKLKNLPIPKTIFSVMSKNNYF